MELSAQRVGGSSFRSEDLLTFVATFEPLHLGLCGGRWAQARTRQNYQHPPVSQTGSGADEISQDMSEAPPVLFF